MLVQALLGRRRLHDAAARRQIAAQHRGGAVAVDRIVERLDDVGVVDRGVRDVFGERLAGDRHLRGIEHAAQLHHQRPEAAGIVEILHQESAGRPHIGDHRHLARNLVEAVHVERNAGAARHGDEMDDAVGRAGHRHVHLDGVVDRGLGDDLVRRQVVPHHLDDAAAGGDRHARMSGVRRRDRRRARQREAERLGDRHHGRGRAHRHAGAERARDAAFDLLPLLLGDLAGALLVPVFPGVGAGAEHLAVPVAAQHRPGRHEDRRHAHRRSRPSAGRAWSCRSRRAAPRRRSDGCAAVPRLPSPAGCGRASWSA